MVVGLLLTGCSSFVAADKPSPAPMGSGTTATDGSSAGSTSTGGTTGNAEGTGDGSADGSTTTSDATSTDTSGSATGDALDSSSGSTSGPEVFPFEGIYSGTFDAPCGQITVDGNLSIQVNAAGVISGTATALSQTANVTGSVDAVGSVMGAAMITGVGACELTGDIAPGNLGTGVFSCPEGCVGTWLLVEI